MDFIQQYIEQIRKAQFEAEKENIKTNAIMIDEHLYKSTFVGGSIDSPIVVPMICGLKAFSSKQLPSDTAFSIFHATALDKEDEFNLTAQIKRLEIKLSEEQAKSEYQHRRFLSMRQNFRKLRDLICLQFSHNCEQCPCKILEQCKEQDNEY